MVRIGSDIGGKMTYHDFLMNCLIPNDGVTLLPIAIYRAKNSKVLKNEVPFILTNPEKRCLLLVIFKT